ncbi:hypothetical protein HN784_05225 [bacterium]|jgi:hypothetical protein|nr:hypothetical protein [bacterium]MBT4250769.1 hypothetical protein [bacterium]MBT4598213.1 hypothetical protein [bacterium]MBT6753811.1 hypothetical protein [bacterium]MBT7037476.1 hypothetical protein [bacterium]
MNISINFLPTERREEIKNLKYIGVVMRVGVMAVLALCVFVTFLGLIRYTINIEKDFVESEILRFENSKEYQQTKVAQDSLREYSYSAKTIKSGLKQKRNFTGLISQISEMIPDGIILNKLSVDNKNVVLSGVALERKSLLILEQRLMEDQRFKSVDSPISNFVSETNAEFSFKMELK